MNFDKLKSLLGAFLLGALINLYLTNHYFHWYQNTKQYFKTSLIITIVYTFSFISILGLMIFRQSISKSTHMIAKQNWSLSIYMSLWVLLILTIIQIFFCGKLGVNLLDYTMVLFLIKGVFLIPVLIQKLTKNESLNYILYLLTFESFIIFIVVLTKWHMGEVGNIER